jgi:hypothetical protein
MHEPNAEHFGGTPYCKAPDFLNQHDVSYMREGEQSYSILTIHTL